MVVIEIALGSVLPGFHQHRIFFVLQSTDILQRSSLTLTSSSLAYIMGLLTHLRVSVQVMNEIENSVPEFSDILETCVFREFCYLFLPESNVEQAHQITPSLNRRVIVRHRLSSGGPIDSRTGRPSFCSGPTSRTASRESFPGRTGDCGSDQGPFGLTTVSRSHGSAQSLEDQKKYLLVHYRGLVIISNQLNI
jgi:hypothetical protein